MSPTGWANAATIDVVYDLLHMMGRDDIPIGLGDMFVLNQSEPGFPSAGDCKYAKAVPQGCGGFLDSDTLYGLARDLPRSPRRYLYIHHVAIYTMQQNSVGNVISETLQRTQWHMELRGTLIGLKSDNLWHLKFGKI